MLFCAVSCNSTTYNNDVAISDIAAAIDTKLSNADVLIAVDEAQLDYFNSEYSALVTEYTIKISSSGTLFDEYGIFKVENEADTADIVKMIEEYIEFRVDADMGYLPTELPKIKNGKTKSIGNYVIYAFLSDADTDAAFAEFETVLTK